MAEGTAAVVDWPETKTYEVDVRVKIRASSVVGATGDLEAILRRAGVMFEIRGEVK